MNPSSSQVDDNIIAAFVQEFDAATDKPAVAARFAERYPQLGGSFFADYASGRNLMNEAATTGGSTAHRLQPGEMLGDFRIVRELERGGQGEIYEARQLHLNERRVAIKVIRDGKVNPNTRERFMREQRALAKLQQSNILPALAAGERGEIQYFAMPFVDGANLGYVVNLLRTRSRQTGVSATSSLAQIVKNANVQSSPTAPTASESQSTPAPDVPDSQASPELTNEYLRSVASSLAEVADALHAAHQANMVHRDVKPANLMVERETGKCWLIDFGLAGLVGQVSNLSEPVGQVSNLSELTETGSIMGTFAYMAPEQFDGRPEKRSDIWALGVTLYELLTLRRPFPDPPKNDDTREKITREKIVDWYKRQFNQHFPTGPGQITNVPPDLDAICMKAMQKDTNNRYATAKEFADDLRHWLRGEPTTANPPWAGRRMAMWAKREPGWAVSAAMACVILVGITIAVTLRQRDRARAAVRESELKTLAEAERLQERHRTLVSFDFQRRAAPTAGWRDLKWNDGLTLAAGGKEPELRDGMAALLGGIDARLVPDFREGAARSVLFSPDGKRLLMGGFRHTPGKRDVDQTQPTRVRDLATGEVKNSTQIAEGSIGWRGNVPVQLVTPTAKRSTMLLWDVDRNATVDEFAFSDALRPVDPNTQASLSVICRAIGLSTIPLTTLVVEALSSDGNLAAALIRGTNGKLSIVVWQAGKQAPTASIPIENIQSRPTAFALSPDGSLLGLGMENGQVATWSLAGELKTLPTFNLSRSTITALTFVKHRHLTDPSRVNPSGVSGWLLAAGDAAGQIGVWNLSDFDRISHSRDSHHEVYGLAFSPDATTLYSTGRTECRCWDVASSRQILRVNLEGRNFVVGVAASSNGSRLALSTIPMFSPDGGVDVFDLETGRGIQTLRGITGQIRRITITPDGKWTAAISQEWTVGVWNASTGELVASFDAPKALYADHDDLRMTNDGRFLVIAGGEEAQRWELPSRPGAQLRKTDTWKLPPSWQNRLAITPEGKVLLCRNETKSGKNFPNAVHPSVDPRCVSIYELGPANDPQRIARHFDHAWHVFNIHAVPDGSCFIADGNKKREMSSRSIIAYEGKSDQKMWSIEFPNAQFEGNSGIDSTGSVLRYLDPRPEDVCKQRLLPFHGADDTHVSAKEVLALGQQFVFKDPQHDLGLHLARPGAASDLLALSPDERIPNHNYQMTADGRFLIWGTENGTVNVCDLHRVRELLVAAGFPEW